MSERDHFARVDALFRQACQLDDAEARRRFLDEQCGDDARLRREVQALLNLDAATSGPLDDPPSLATSLIANARNNPAVEQNAPGRIGGYRIIQRIGTGGMGTVYEAEQDSPRRLVALKVISPGLVSRSMLRRFQFETEVLGRLQHSGIAQIYEAGTFDNGAGEQPYFAMELVEGTPIMQYAQQRDLSTQQRLELLASICDAVQHAHQRGVIHRDLKPANVLVTDAGQPKILDFGVARATDSDLQVTTLQTNIGQIVGTVPYMSPEQATGDPHAVDTRSDVYSLGVLGYELLTGRLPYDVREKMLHEALRSIREDEPTPLSTHSRLLAGDVATMIGKALEKDSGRRYQSAAEFAEDIRRYLRQEPIVARRPSRVYQLRMFARRHKPFVAAGSIAVAALIVATVVSISFAVSEASQRTRAERRFDDVRQLANAFLFDVDEQLQDVAGATPARESLVTTALTYLDHLASDPSADAALLDELADAYIRVGDIQGNPRKPNLGDSHAALKSYRRSLELRRMLVAQAPEDVTQLQKLSGAHRKIGMLQSYLGQPQETLEAYHRALAITEDALAAEPDHLELLHERVTLHGLIGDIQRQMGRYEASRASFSSELELARALVRRDPEDSRARRALSLACNDLGSVLSRLGSDDDALAYFQEALGIRQALAEASPENVRARRDLAVSLNRVANAQRALGQHAEALENYQRGLTVFSDLSEEDPSNARAQFDLSVQYEKVGLAQEDLERTSDALDSFQQCAELRRALVRTDPDNLYAQVGLAIALERSADVLRTLGRPTEAEENYLTAVRTAEAIVEVDAQFALAQTVRCMASFKLGALHEQFAEAAPPKTAEQAEQRTEAARWYARSSKAREEATALEVQLQAEPEGLDAALQRFGLSAQAGGAEEAGAEPTASAEPAEDGRAGESGG